jgi:hypothetical protein
MNQFETFLKTGERLTFISLFTHKRYHVEIPLIQRDYAQGRETAFEVRNNFLDALFDYLSENKPNRDLDFIYGSIVETNGVGKFIPLDGQQRLTTLFLLHWYLSLLAGKFESFQSQLYDENKKKSKFSYETRISSKEFCDAMMENGQALSTAIEINEKDKNALSKAIRDCSWYFQSWDMDPTIKSMLIMLDAIHDKFADHPEFYDRLVDENNPVITFFHLDIGKIGLTDDLYIKMNARGKHLTDFENFKAKFEKYIGSNLWDTLTINKLEFKEGEKSVNLKDYFSYRIDTCWADLFWHYRNETSDDMSFDDEIMNFIRVILANKYAVNCFDNKDIKRENLFGTDVARKEKDYTDTFTFHVFENLNALNKESVIFLIDSLDLLYNGTQGVRTYLNNTNWYNEEEIFKKIIKHNFTMPERVRFHAYLRYLIYNKDNIAGLEQWMRVVRNLTENTIFNGSDDVSKAMQAIEKLLPYSKNILEYLRDENNPIEFFWSRPVQEERIKAHLIERFETWKNAIITADLHPYFAGQIGFIFEFSGILEYYETNSDCNWPHTEDKTYFDKFSMYFKKADAVSGSFSKRDHESDESYLLERATLSKGNYLIEASAHRFNFLNTTRNSRDFSWKRLLRMPDKNDKDKEKWDNRHSYVKAVIDDPKFNTDDLYGSLNEIRKTVPDDWRKHFIQNPELIRYCQQGFISFYNENKILILKESQHNHKHGELFSYLFYLIELKGKESLFSPFTRTWYYEVKGSENRACAVVDNWFIGKSNYGINIYFNDDKRYKICFFDRNNISIEAPIAAVAQEAGMKMESLETGNSCYVIYKEVESETVHFIKKLSSFLSIFTNVIDDPKYAEELL